MAKYARSAAEDQAWKKAVLAHLLSGSNFIAVNIDNPDDSQGQPDTQYMLYIYTYTPVYIYIYGLSQYMGRSRLQRLSLS